jgi:membrane-bound lytic murein transglycosylase B
MGQCQFMPTSFFKYAADGDADGRYDIWTDLADVFASTANYLRTEGWNGKETWGRAVRLTQPIAESATGVKVQLTLSEWAQYGITSADGSPLPNVPLDASLVQPGGPNGPSYLVYNNFRVLLHWNRSSYFAAAVGILADQIGH